MNKHTPGPWCVGDSDLPVSQMAVMQAEPTRKHSTIARMSKGIQPFEEISANLKLMAAAPDLLKSTKNLLDAVITQCEYEPNSATATWVREARAAIAKATGIDNPH